MYLVRRLNEERSKLGARRRGTHAPEDADCLMNISLKQFLETGRLGDLRLWDTVERVRSLLGQPEDAGGVSRKHP